jgi:hypothetical protein
MLQHLLFRLLSLLGVATGTAVEADVEEVSSPRVAQVRLAEALAEADAILGVRAHGDTFTFSIVRGDRAIDLAVTTRAKRTKDSPKGEVISFASAPAKSAGEGDISWLGEELASTTAIVKLVADEDGAVTVFTHDGRRYMVIPGRGSGGGNDAVEARWAGEWDSNR